MPNGSRAPCTTMVGTLTASGSQAARRRPGRGTTWWLERERDADHAHGTRPLSGAASHTSPERAPAGEGPQASQFAGDQLLDDRRERRIELAGRSPAASPRDPVGLLDERDVESRRARVSPKREGRRDAAPRSNNNAEQPQNVPEKLCVRPFVVSVTVTSVNTTVIGGLHDGWNVAVAVSVKSALPFCTGKSPAAETLVLFAAFG